MIGTSGGTPPSPAGPEALIRPESVSEPEAPTTAPEGTESHTGEIPPQSEPNRCACQDSGVLNGAACPFCDLGQTECRFCKSRTEPRAYDSAGKVACVDEEACAVRDAATAVAPVLFDPRTVEVDEDDPALRPDACPLCHSTRASLVFVPPTHLEEAGQWRCQNGSACKSRQQLAGAREKLSE